MPNEAQEKDLQASLRVGRIVSGCLCFGAPLVYLAVFVLQGLRGDPRACLQGFAQVPWGNPMVPVLLGMSGLMGILALVLPDRALRSPRLAAMPLLARLRTRLVLACALVEAVAVWGLFLGFTLGPPVASLSLAMMLVPMGAGIFLLPSEADWRRRVEEDLAGGPAR